MPINSRSHRGALSSPPASTVQVRVATHGSLRPAARGRLRNILAAPSTENAFVRQRKRHVTLFPTLALFPSQGLTCRRGHVVFSVMATHDSAAKIDGARTSRLRMTGRTSSGGAIAFDWPPDGIQPAYYDGFILRVTGADGTGSDKYSLARTVPQLGHLVVSESRSLGTETEMMRSMW